MNKELKRYILAEYAGFITRTCNSKEEYEELIKKVNKYNSTNKNDKLFGNISYTIDKNNKYQVIINGYRKLTPKMTISDLDELTSKYQNEKELINAYSDKLERTLSKGNKPLIRIVYLEDKNKKEKTNNDVDRGINNIDVLYGEDIKYMSYSYLKLCIKYYININDYGFFLDMANKFESNKSVIEIIEKIRILINEARNKGIKLEETNIMYLVDKLYCNYILERNNNHVVLRDEKGNEIKNRRRIRDFAFFVRNYNIAERKKHLGFMKFDEPNHDESKTYMEKRIENEEDSIMEEEALDAWDQGRIYRRK